jgi:hypothetical protein
MAWNGTPSLIFKTVGLVRPLNRVETLSGRLHQPQKAGRKKINEYDVPRIEPDRYPLQETDSSSYPLARRYGKPCLVVDLKPGNPSSLRTWLEKKQIGVLNVAGPRESKNPGISRLGN